MLWCSSATHSTLLTPMLRWVTDVKLTANKDILTAAILLFNILQRQQVNRSHTGFRGLLLGLQIIWRPKSKTVLVSLPPQAHINATSLPTTGNWKYDDGVSSIGITFIPSIVKIGHLFQKLQWRTKKGASLLPSVYFSTYGFVTAYRILTIKKSPKPTAFRGKTLQIQNKISCTFQHVVTYFPRTPPLYRTCNTHRSAHHEGIWGGGGTHSQLWH